MQSRLFRRAVGAILLLPVRQSANNYRSSS